MKSTKGAADGEAEGEFVGCSDGKFEMLGLYEGEELGGDVVGEELGSLLFAE